MPCSFNLLDLACLEVPSVILLIFIYHYNIFNWFEIMTDRKISFCYIVSSFYFTQCSSVFPLIVFVHSIYKCKIVLVLCSLLRTHTPTFIKILRIRVARAVTIEVTVSAVFARAIIFYYHTNSSVPVTIDCRFVKLGVSQTLPTTSRFLQ